MTLAALACGGATDPERDDSLESNHGAALEPPLETATNDSPAAAGDAVVAPAPIDAADQDAPPTIGDMTVAHAPEPPAAAEVAPSSCLGEPDCPWSVRAAMPDAMRGQAAVPLDGRIYTIGGEGLQDDLRIFSPPAEPAPTGLAPLYTTVRLYDPAADSWSDRARLPIGIYVLTAHVLAGKIYVFAGYGPQGFETRVQVYDPPTDTWQLGPALPTARYLFTTEVVDDKIYVIGGQGPRQDDETGAIWDYMSNVDIFDPATGWSSGSPSPQPLADGASCAIDGKVFVFGGQIDGGNWIYDVATDQWTQGTPSPLSRAAHACVRVGDDFYLIGGHSAGIPTPIVEKYDPAADTWESLPSLPTARHWLGATAVGDEIFTFGGEVLAPTPLGEWGLSNAVEVLRVAQP